MLIGVPVDKRSCSRCDREWNGYSSKVKDFKDLGIKIKMILDNKKHVKVEAEIIQRDLQHYYIT
jgi:hypothetical protein